MSKTNQDQCSTDQNKYTQVKTVYARACIILLAINFCLTGYVLNGVMKVQTEQAGGPQSSTPTLSTSPQTVKDVPPTLEAREEELEAQRNGVVHEKK
jgi:hypothetical protein